MGIEIVESLDDIRENFLEFNKIRKGDNNEPYKRFIYFRHWYYLNENEIFAPSKFIGYKKTTLEHYCPKSGDGEQDGRETERILKKYFIMVEEETLEYKSLYEKLKNIASNIDRKLNSRIYIHKQKIDYKNKKQNIQKRNNVNKTNSLIKKQQHEFPYEIAQRVRKIILSINEICRLQNKKDIFDQAALFELWENIEKPCKSKNDFKGFTENLYKLLREKTRDKNPNKKTKNDPHYLFKIPNNFLKDGTSTKQFWDIVNTLRHYFVHEEIGNIANVYKEFLGSSSGPESSEDYLKLQTKILNLFEESMNILLEMIKNN